MGGCAQMTQDLRQLARGELAGSARAVAEAGESGKVHAGRLARGPGTLAGLLADPAPLRRQPRHRTPPFMSLRTWSASR